MREIFVINDLHIGAIRSEGTTLASAYQLRLSLLEGLKRLLEQATTPCLLINGDLFDKESVPMSDLFATWQLLRNWLNLAPSRVLYLPPGNHDLSKVSTTFTSFDMLVKLLESEFGGQVVSSRQGFPLAENAWVIPHVANQDLFELELSQVPKGMKYLFLHCNFNNGFAAQSDHSLNLSLEQARYLQVGHIVLGHEHQRSAHLDGKVLVVGNQLPSSVADCLGNEQKYALKISDEIEWVAVADIGAIFQRKNWRCSLPIVKKRFVRVEGSAEVHEAAEVVAAISKLRKTSDALVITNAVEIAGQKNTQQLARSLEAARGFNVLEALLKTLTAEEQQTVKTLLGEANA